MTKSKLLFCVALALTSAGVQAADDNVHFSGALVSEPCNLPDADTDIHLDFGTIVEKYLYQHERTKSQPFSIHLEECDPSVLSTVSVTFQGTADTVLNNLLALDASSTAKGVAIGLELADGTPLPVNKPSPFSQLNSGNTTLVFNAFVQAQPATIADKNLTPGDFTAISTFLLNYQ